jgi:hypothetical protein
MTNTRQRRLQDEWLGLQRCRALTLASLRSLNEQLEDIRPELRDPPPLDGFTEKIGGTGAEPGSFGLWLDRFIALAVEAEIVTEEELPAA